MEVQVSENFKRMAKNAVLSIILFVVVYVLLLSLAIALTVGCAILGITIVVGMPSFVTLVLGIGLASSGFFILIFLFKFLFKKHKVDRSHLTQITAADEPQLFKLIEAVTSEVKTDFPKKVYLSPDVNASVFYDSTFWSMFLPIRKNLQIGIGLVNTSTVEEFKAILAHEFGHFSQRSMKVGSYVYNVNQVIFNMLFDNESFDNMVQRWANITGYFSIFLIAALKIINAIQWVLRKMYEFVNVRYMALSREMEFHADEVAAHVTGYLPLKTSLLRMDLADYSFNAVLNFYGDKVRDNFKSKDIFAEHRFVMNFLARESNIPLENDLPVVTEQDTNKYNKSKLTIKDQWASHPSVEERIAALEKLGIVKENSNQNPAISLFSKSDNTVRELTEKLFSNVAYQGDVVLLEKESFQDLYTERYHKNSFPKAYNSYYDHKIPIHFDVDSVGTTAQEHDMESLFSPEMVDVVYDCIALENDKAVLQSIATKEFPIKTFDYDGQKYKAKEAGKLVEQLEQQRSLLHDSIAANDISIFQLFLKNAIANGNGDTFKHKYKEFFELDKALDVKMEFYNEFIATVEFMHQVTPFEVIQSQLEKVSNLEIKLGEYIREIMLNTYLAPELAKDTLDNFNIYISKKWTYFYNEKYDDDNLKILFTALNDFNTLTGRAYYLVKLSLLEYQIKQ